MSLFQKIDSKLFRKFPDSLSASSSQFLILSSDSSDLRNLSDTSLKLLLIPDKSLRNPVKSTSSLPEFSDKPADIPSIRTSEFENSSNRCDTSIQLFDSSGKLNDRLSTGFIILREFVSKSEKA